ncbi:MAG: MYXO-CTERM sorting domain-containing protein, partial [Myxococcota bacterium]
SRVAALAGEDGLRHLAALFGEDLAESLAALDGGRVTTHHELFHAVQYGFDPSINYTTHYSTWPWWSEGTATWAESKVAGNPSSTFNNIENYLGLGHLALHQDITALFDPDRLPFLYGTTLLAYSLESHAGADAIRRTLEVGAAQAGEPAWFPDVIEAVDLDFDALWSEHLARLPTMDHPFGRDLASQPAIVSAIREIPGRAEGDPERLPQGLGWAIHRLRPPVLEGTDLDVTFTGAEGARWHVVIVAAPRNRAGAPATVVHTGIVEGTTPLRQTLAYADPMWIVVSPEADSDDGFPYTVELAAVADDDEPAGGCQTSPAPLAGAGLLLMLPLFRRRRRPLR